MRTNSRWLLYGAYGYSGRLILEEALRRGHKPVIAGRNEERLSYIAEQFGLEKRAFSLNDKAKLKKALQDVTLVFNAAGPFIYTFEPLCSACIEMGKHYIDITGEYPVFERAFTLDKEAQRRKVCLLPGAGFDVVPTDCLAKYLSEELPDATFLELAFAGMSKMSRGTIRTMIEFLPQGGLVRRDGELVTVPIGAIVKKIPFSFGAHTVISIPWGDLSTAYRSTKIRNITTFMGFPTMVAHAIYYTGDLLQKILRFRGLQRTLQFLVKRFISGPDESLRTAGRAFVYGKVLNSSGKAKEAWLETIEVYKFTAIAGLLCVENVLEKKPSGTFTPSIAFGSDFVFKIEGTKRFDFLPVS